MKMHDDKFLFVMYLNLQWYSQHKFHKTNSVEKKGANDTIGNI